MGKALWCAFFALVGFGAVFASCRMSDACDRKNGVLVKDAWGLPVCVPRAVAP